MIEVHFARGVSILIDKVIVFRSEAGLMWCGREDRGVKYARKLYYMYDTYYTYVRTNDLVWIPIRIQIHHGLSIFVSLLINKTGC